jgi:hypothetical protein
MTFEEFFDRARREGEILLCSDIAARRIWDAATLSERERCAQIVRLTIRKMIRPLMGEGVMDVHDGG